MNQHLGPNDSLGVEPDGNIMKDLWGHRYHVGSVFTKELLAIQSGKG